MPDDNIRTGGTPARGNVHGAERSQTDESLRVERETVDQALEEELAAIDETADAVIARARARADEVLAAARARTDRESASQTHPQNPDTVQRARIREDRAIQQERATADTARRQERADHVGTLAREREDTDQDLSNERARSDRALATRDEFLGIVSHDLRNMLNAVIGFAGLIETGVERDDHVEPVRANAERIQRSAARMNRLVGDLVDVASIEAGRLAVTREDADPAAVVMEAVETFQPQASAQGVSVEVEKPPSPVLIPFDPARILQVVTNLLSNAIKFTPRDGKVVVRVARAADSVRVDVIDSGTGVPSDQLEAVFEPFLQLTRGDRRGVGLGLYISKAIVEGHGGRIWVENASGRGSTFCFTLPSGMPADSGNPSAGAERGPV